MPADFPSRLDLFAIGRDFVTTRNTKIDPDQVDIEGSDVNIVTAAPSFTGYALVLQLISRINALLLDGSDGEDLDRITFDRYQETRKGAAAAFGAVQFNRKVNTVGLGTIPVGTKIVSLGNVEYVTLQEATFSATDLGPKEVEVRSTQAGFATQVGKNQIRRFDSPADIFDPTIEINNSEATANAADREEDDIYRERARGFFLAARRGTRGAIVFGAKTVGGIESAFALEALTTDGRPARIVTLYVADGTGSSSRAIGAEVDQALEEYRAAGINVVTVTSIPQIVDLSLKLTFRAGVDTTSLTTNIRAAIVEYVNSLPVNGTLLRADLFAALSRYKTQGLIVDTGTVIAPTGDLVPSAGQTLRTTLANVVIT